MSPSGKQISNDGIIVPTVKDVDAFLAGCLRATLAKDLWPQWPAQWNNTAATEAVAERATFHGIAVVLHESERHFEYWPEEAAKPLMAEARVAAMWEEMHRQTVVRLIDTLAERGVATLVMKGTALAYLYLEDPASRRRGDTDLLIRIEDLDTTRTVLEELGGYRRNDPYGLFFQETWLIDCGAQSHHSIDLHWEPADRPVLQRVLTSEEFWKGSIPVPRLSEHAKAPDPVLMLVQGAINQLWHRARGFFVNEEDVTGGRRLIWAIDYAHLVEQFDASQWERLVLFCRERQVSPVVLEALEGARHDLALALPDQRLEELSADTQPSPAYGYITTPDHVGDMWADILTAETVQQKARILNALLFPPRSHLEQKYPDKANWPTFLLHLRRFAGAVTMSPSGGANS